MYDHKRLENCPDPGSEVDVSECVDEDEPLAREKSGRHPLTKATPSLDVGLYLDL